jgi:D-3-phosphoglycerate dehydrogenase
MPRRPLIVSLTMMREEGLALLRAAGTLQMASALEPDVLRREVAEADALVIRTAGVIDAALMDAAPRLRVIGRHGVGCDQIDIEAATERGIQVVYTPGANTEAVAEHTLAFLVGLSKHFPQQMRALREGRYLDRTRLVGRDLKGRTLGIIGFGRIGRRVAEIAHIGVGMKVLYNDIVAAPLKVETHLGAHRVSFETLLSDSEYVTLHVPLDASTRHMIDARALARIHPGACLVNTCRGPVVDESAVAEALDRGQLAGYAADVFEREPPPPDHPLIGRDDCLLTPHSAAQTVEGLTNMARGVAEDVVGVLRGEPPRNPFNDPSAVAESRRRLGKPPLSEGLIAPA